jgi:hypothetical protein
VKKVAAGGAVVEDREPLGAVFAPLPGVAMRPAYSFGPPDSKVKTPVFQCPVSAVPPLIWDLLEDWWACRLMGCLPVAGGFVDQPLLVRRAFPFFEQEQRAFDARQSGPLAVAGALAGALRPQAAASRPRR